jgi:glycogen operon protein
MILGGDEFLRTQRGNNNAYCQDNEISWFDWTLESRHADILEFFRKVIGLTCRFPILCCRKFLLGEDLDDDQVPALTWFGVDLGWPPWHDSDARTLCYQLDAGEDAADPTATRLFFILNARWDQQWVKLPALVPGRGWSRIIDTSLPSGEDFLDAGQEIPIDPPDHYIANPRSTVVLLGR